MKKFGLKIGIDVDDILFQCSEYACTLINNNKELNPPLSLEEITGWGKSGNPRTDSIFKYFGDESFYKTQPLIPGAKEFISKISKMAEIFFVTAVYPEFMGIRAKRLMDEFPEVPSDNIIMGHRKDLVNVDILLDDGSHNIKTSNSTYPVLMRKPWNRDLSGGLSVNNFDDFLQLVKSIKQAASAETKLITGENRMFCFIGPSGSGKTTLLNALEREGVLNRVVSYTTRRKRKNEVDGKDYYFLSDEEFLEKKDDFLETTSYAGAYYGTHKEIIAEALKENNAGIAIDICGGIAMKNAFPNTVLVYVDRPKKDLILSILNRNIPDIEKTNRIISLPEEEKNADLCDELIENVNLSEALKQFYDFL